MKETLRTVKYSVQDDAKFEKIALKLGRSKRQVFSQMLDYFYRSKKDPLDLNDELLKNTILRGQKEYIGFIRTQEKDLLIPIKKDGRWIAESLKEIRDCFDQQVLRHNKLVITNQQDQVKMLTALNTAVAGMIGRSETRGRLKEKFLFILNSYIRERDTLGMMSSSREKEDLAGRFLKQIDLL